MLLIFAGCERLHRLGDCKTPDAEIGRLATDSLVKRPPFNGGSSRSSASGKSRPKSTSDRRPSTFRYAKLLLRRGAIGGRMSCICHPPLPPRHIRSLTRTGAKWNGSSHAPILVRFGAG